MGLKTYNKDFQLNIIHLNYNYQLFFFLEYHKYKYFPVTNLPDEKQEEA